jgi:PAS domain S-box-containing protein
MTNNRFTKQFFFSSLGGRMLVFFTLIGLGVVSFTVYLNLQVWKTNERIANVEQVYYPIATALERLQTDFGQYLSSIRDNVLRTDTIGGWKVDQLLAGSIIPGLQQIKDNRERFSPLGRSFIDSIEQTIVSAEKKKGFIHQWVTDHYLSIPDDSTLQANLLGGEQSFLIPQAEQIGLLQQKYQRFHDTLQSDMDQQLIENLNAIRFSTSALLRAGVVVGALVLLILVAGGYWLFRKFNFSLERAVSILRQLVKGEASDFVIPGRDEFRPIIEASNDLSGNLQRASAFARSIGEGNVNFEFSAVTDQDVLGNSLVQMRQKLKEINDEDKKRNWVTTGLANFADIMRRNEDYKELANTLISELVKYTKSNQGGMFIVNQDNEKDSYLDLIACYAFERKKYLERRIEIGVGLVGQCYLERRTIYLKEIPEDYVTITSGLGGANPSALLIVPLKVNVVIEGVLEIASFKDYQPYEIEFVEKVGEIIAATISNARINDRTRKLLSESQQHSEELRAQEEEMRQNMEEMQATQEQMQRQTEEMKKMQGNLELEKSMLSVLMEYLPDRITYKDSESRILRINRSKAEKFKMAPEEMVGKTDYDFFSEEHADRAFREEQELIRSGVPLLNTEERAVFANGEVAWSSTSRIPFKNERNETVGMFIITKDITQLKTAELTIKDRERVIQRLLDGMPIFRFTVGRDGVLHNIWKANGLSALPTLEAIPVEKGLPEVYDLIGQEGLQDTDLICKGVLEIDEEKEVFKYYLFRDSAYDGVFLGFGLKQ